MSSFSPEKDFQEHIPKPYIPRIGGKISTGIWSELCSGWLQKKESRGKKDSESTQGATMSQETPFKSENSIGWRTELKIEYEYEDKIMQNYLD